MHFFTKIDAIKPLHRLFTIIQNTYTPRCRASGSPHKQVFLRFYKQRNGVRRDDGARDIADVIGQINKTIKSNTLVATGSRTRCEQFNTGRFHSIDAGLHANFYDSFQTELYWPLHAFSNLRTRENLIFESFVSAQSRGNRLGTRSPSSTSEQPPTGLWVNCVHVTSLIFTIFECLKLHLNSNDLYVYSILSNCILRLSSTELICSLTMRTTVFGFERRLR